MQLSNSAQIWAVESSERVVVGQTEVGEIDVGDDVDDNEMGGDGEEYEVVGDGLDFFNFVCDF